MRGATTPTAAFVTIGALLASCTFESTQVVVTVDTDLPASVPATMTFCVSPAAGGAPSCAEIIRGARRDAGIARLPGSFTVRPQEGAGRDDSVSVLIELRPLDLTRAPLRRTIRFQFIPRRSLQTRVFLAARCASSTTGCSRVPPMQCTVSQRCEEQGLTCGDEGVCVRPDTELVAFDPRTPGSELDASRRDAADDLGAPADGPADAGVDAVMDGTAPTEDVASDAGVDTGVDTGIVDTGIPDSGTCMASGSCMPSPCQTGERRCVSGTPTCVATGFVAAGVACGGGMVCNGMGSCITCASGAPCAPTAACQRGQISCSAGMATCMAIGPAPAGTMCGPMNVCSAAGACVPCSPGSSCVPGVGGPCARGTIACGSGAPVCVAGGVAPVDTPCPGGICNAAGTCVPCMAGGACPAPQCRTGRIRCALGMAICDQTPAMAGTMCDDGNPCTGGDACDGAGACRGTPLTPTENRYSNQGANGGEGVCVLERYYCSTSGVVSMAPPAGYYGGRGGAFCEFHSCTGTMCQVNFCKNCVFDCAANCP